MNAMILVWAVVAVIGLVIFLWFFPVTLWFQALISGVRISLIQLVLMRWRGQPFLSDHHGYGLLHNKELWNRLLQDGTNQYVSSQIQA